MGHHYVPRFYLRGFAHDERIWAYDKESGRHFPTQVKSIANETGMYSDDLERKYVLCKPRELVWCANLFCTYLETAARVALARVTLARMSDALAVQMNGLGCAL